MGTYTASPLAILGLALTLAPTALADPVRVVEPRDGDLLYGPTTIRAAIEGERPVARVRFLLDSYPRPICIVQTPPYDCEFDAGTDFQGHTIRVQAIDTRGETIGWGSVKSLAFPEPEVVSRRTLSVPVVVRSPQGASHSLEPDQLGCFYAGRPCVPVSAVKLSEQQRFPVSLEVLVDVSGSVDPNRLELLEALWTVIEAAPVGVEISTTEFAATYIRLTEFTTNKEELRGAMQRLGAGGLRTCLVDALLRSLRRLQAAPGHRLLFVISDGEENCRKNTGALAYMDWLYQIVTESRAVSAPIYIYRFEELRGIDTPRSSFAKSYEGVARETGGRLFAHGSIHSVGSAFDAVIEDLEATWLVDLDLPHIARADWQRRLVLELAGDEEIRLFYPEYWEAENREDTWIATMSSPDPRARLWAASNLAGNTTARVLRAMARAFADETEPEIRAQQIVAIRDMAATLLLHGNEAEQKAAVAALERLNKLDPIFIEPLHAVLAVYPSTGALPALARRVTRLSAPGR